MPELPDLELYVHNLKKKYEGKTLDRVTVYDIFRVTAVEADFNRELAGRPVDSVARNGKEILFNFGQSFFAVHLMLSGEFSAHDKGENLEGISCKCASFEFDDSVLLIRDPGKKCRTALNPVLTNVPDVFSEKFTKEYFLKKLASRKKSGIKDLLTDQKIMKGIGNAYSDEILYECRIDPASVCSMIPEQKAEELYASIGTVLHRAVDELFRLTPEAISGETREFLKVHRHDIDRTQSGAVINTSMINGRKTFYTDEQVLYRSGRPF